MVTRLLLIRHGETVWNGEGRIQGWSDSVLSERGRLQMAQVAERVAAYPVEAIYVSTLGRARESGEILAARLNLPLIQDERLREYGIGKLEGLTWADIEAGYPEVARQWRESDRFTPLPGEEGRLVFFNRVWSAMMEIVERHPDATVAVVAHGGTIAAFLHRLLNLALDRSAPFGFENSSLSMVDYRPGRPRIVLLNDTCHLNEHQPVLGEARESTTQDEPPIANSL